MTNEQVEPLVVRAAHIKAQNAITDAVHEFERKTGLRITKIWLGEVAMTGSANPSRAFISCDE